jgi:tetratricopeptide (TPR) repeat protein
VKPTQKAVLLLLLLGALARGTVATPAPPAHEALDYGFKIASAIETDPKGKGRVQTRLLMVYLSKDALDEAKERAPRVDGWWRGVALAEVAVKLAAEGRDDEAREFVRQAEEARQSVTGWQNPRISGHVAHALALLGELDRSREAARMAEADDPRQYAGQVAATTASGYAAQGEFARAMQELRAPEGDLAHLAPVVASSRTSAYLELARMKGLSDEQRAEALMAARDALRGLGGLQQVGALRLVAEELHALGRRKEAVEALDAAERALVPVGEQPTRSTTLLAELARSWVKLGERERAAKLLEEAERAVREEANIDQPGLYAQVAAARAAMGEQERAWSVFDQALTLTESLSNARPRAFAAVEICRWIGIEGLTLTDAARGRLDALYAGLRDPW